MVAFSVTGEPVLVDSDPETLTPISVVARFTLETPDVDKVTQVASGANLVTPPGVPDLYKRHNAVRGADDNGRKIIFHGKEVSRA